MIPIAVELTDFLSHRCSDGEPVKFDFDGAVLWAVSGDNGAGKSAIFDAITWTLFGQHRGGSQQADQLICHGADRCQTAFTFELDETRYRVVRSARRRKGTRRGAYRWDSGNDKWEPIPDTTSKTGFASWRDGLLGLKYEAFIHSVLLLQNGSDRLIRSGAKERFDVLAQLVDLSAFQQLEDRAKDRASTARALRKALEGEINRLPAVTDHEREAATAARDQLNAEHETRSQAVEAQQAVVNGAKQYAGLSERLEAAQTGIAEAEALLADREQIEAEASLAETLRASKDPLERGLEALDNAAEAQEQATAASEELGQIDLPELESAAAQARELADQAREAADAAATTATAKAEPLAAIEAVVRCRAELAAAEQQVNKTGTVATADQLIEQCQSEIDDLSTGLDKARATEQDGRQQVARCQAALKSERESLAALEAGEEEAVCSRCGQPVPPGHREVHVREAAEAIDARQAELEAAEAVLAPLTADREQAEQALDDKKSEQGAIAIKRAKAEAAEDRLKRAEAAATTALAAPSFAAWTDPRAQAIASDDPDALAAVVEELQSEAKTARTTSDQLATDADGAETAAKKAEAEAERGRRRQQTLTTSVETHTDLAKTHNQHAKSHLESVGDDWATRAVAGELDLVEQLDERLAELAPALEKRAKLNEAEGKLTGWRAREVEVRGQLDEIPLKHQVAAVEAEAELESRRQSLADTAQSLETATSDLRDLDQREQELELKQEDFERAKRDARLVDRLVTLLGRQGVQGQLLEQASRDLERLGNETLTTISGGNLRLEIARATQRNQDELIISAIDLTADGERTEAAFLSGSEKFRVCVAMAAAIGKYASGRASIDSLIIDEGFGSLDETGRDQMIDELQQLAQLLKRVIVVSHQSEFHDRSRFPHGYLLQRDGNATEVERFL